MTSESKDREEQALRELFDATADSASGPTLTKLAARARDCPERAERLPRWLPRWAWSPTWAGLAVALGAATAAIAIAVGGDRDLSDRGRTGGFAPESRETSSATSSSPSAALESPVSAEELFEPDEDELEPLVLALSWDDELDPEAEYLELYPSSESDLDAWLFATGEVLKEGG